MIRKSISPTQNQELRTMASALVGRAQLFSQLGGQQYGGDRDIYQALGYMEAPTFSDYFGRYQRQDIAKAVIDRPARATWQGPLLLQESSEAEETELEKEWKALEKRLGLKTRFQRVDRLSGIGSYGILLLGLDDISSKEKWASPVTAGSRKLAYVKPYGEGTARIQSYVDDAKDPRFGLPFMYEITISDSVSGSNGTYTTTSSTVQVHYSRCIHIIDDVLENEVVGIPRLECIFNRLMDLEKIVGGDAEMYWRSARPGFQGKVDKDYQLTTEMREALKEQIDEYEHNLRRMLVNEGVTYEELKQQIADPASHVDIQLQMISSVTGIPKRILTGTERGELSSNQDAGEWRSYVEGRRLDHAEPHIVRPFVDKMIEIGVLPDPVDEEYDVVWSDLYAKSEAERVKIGLDRSNSLRNYTSSPMSESVVSPEAFFEYFLGLDDNQIAIIKDAAESEIIKEQQAIGLFPTEETAKADLEAKKKPMVVPIQAKQTPKRQDPARKKGVDPNRTQKGTK